MEKIFEAFAEYLLQLRKDIVSDVVSAISKLPVSHQVSSDEVSWLSPDEARQLIGLKSRNSMKKLRESGEIHYAKIGREFRYEKKSLQNYVLKKSTMRYSLQSDKKRTKK